MPKYEADILWNGNLVLKTCTASTYESAMHNFQNIYGKDKVKNIRLDTK